MSCAVCQVSWNHLKCFPIPKKVDFRNFLEELEVDGLSPAQCAEASCSSASKISSDCFPSTDGVYLLLLPAGHGGSDRGRPGSAVPGRQEADCGGLGAGTRQES